jgi:hypothetical protein
VKWLLLLLPLIAYAANVNLVREGNYFWLQNYGQQTEYCWIEFTDGELDFMYLGPEQRSRRYLFRYYQEWGCY